MAQLIALIVFVISVIGIIVILAGKIPSLVALPQNGHHGFKKHPLIVDAENKIKDLHFHFFEKQLWLHKLLSWLKVLVLKIETRIDHLLHGIRKKAQELDKKAKKKH